MSRALLALAGIGAAWLGITLAALPEGCETLTGWRVPAVIVWWFAAFAANMVVGLKLAK